MTALVPTRIRQGRPDPHLVGLVDRESYEAEQYRLLRHVIEEKRRATGLTAIAVTSPSEGDGKTTTAINLAATLAQGQDVRVLLVEADLRRPAMSRRLGVGSRDTTGLADVVGDLKLRLPSVVRAHPTIPMDVVFAGRGPVVPLDVLESPRFEQGMREAKGMYDYVIVDTPPAPSCPDYRLVERFVDGALIVVAAHKSPRPLLKETLAIVDPAKALGIVFNGDDSRLARYHQRYFGRGRGR
jgi:capsular exopolysaccharide synthesis family protein